MAADPRVPPTVPHALNPLPIDPVLPELAAALDASGAAVLRAPTGAGKTTRVPPALLARLPAGRQVVVVEPRRVAARAAARRMAAEGAAQGWELGREVGYHVRFDRRAGPDTRILVATEGILLQRLQADPFLDGVDAVVFDEFHERRLDADLALAMTRRVCQEVRPDLQVVVMSATLDPAPLTRFLGGCPAVESEGSLYPVAVSWLDERRLPPGVAAAAGGPRPSGPVRPSDIAALAAWGTRRMLDEVAGDLLVFLPGVGEIRRTEEALAADAERRGLLLVPLYGDLPPGEQDAALSPAGRRKVVLATNVAETSVTIEGVEAVVDTGWARVMRFDPASGLDRLVLARVSRASAEQRAGRAGRLGPGRCLRLWSEHEHRGLAEREAPEIARVDLAPAALALAAWGETDLAAFPWFEAPDPARLEHAVELLARLGAVEAKGPARATVTPLGRRLAALPVHPRLGRLLLEGHRRGHGEAAALVAALLSERFPLRPDRAAGPPPPSRSDLLDAAGAVAVFERGGRWHPRLDPAAARFVLRVRDQLAGALDRTGDPERTGTPKRTGPSDRTGTPAAEPPAGAGPADGEDREAALLRAVLAAWPDRVARRRDSDDGGAAQGGPAAHGSGGRSPGPRAVMVGGRGIELAAESAVRGDELFVAVEVTERPGNPEALVRRASAVERAWLPRERLVTEETVDFDRVRERVVARRRTRYEDLVLDEAELPVSGALEEEAARVLAAAAAAAPERALPLDDPEVAGFLARLACLAEWMPELALPRLGPEEIAALLPSLARGRRSFAELRRAPLADLLRGTLTWEQLSALDREAPERLEVPSASRVRLAYEPGRPPVLAVRLQELFGLAETPRVAAGRVPVLLHLLAPNFRPQQVTDDLASFWRNTYPEVRRELKGRYPKHAWPDDPLAAEAVRGARRRRPS